MPNVNFGSFAFAVPSGDDFLVGFRGTSETRITISALTGLNIPLINTVNSLSIASNNYNATYTTVKTTSAFWSTAYSLATTNSARILSIYTTLTANSANWNSVYTTVNTNSSNGGSVYSTVQTNSAGWESVESTVYSNSASWGSVYTTVNTNSANGGNVYTTVQNNSASWNSTYTTVNNNSAGWESVESTVYSNSASWNQAVADSAIALKNTGGSLVAGNLTTWKTLSTQFTQSNEFVSKVYVDSIAQQTAVSGNFVPALYYTKNEVYTKTEVDTNISTAIGGKISLLASSSGNWNSVYSTVNSGSANGSSVYTTVNNNSAGWESVESTVYSNSALWGSVYTTVNTNSSNGGSVYSTVQTNSAGWESVESTVYSNSASWGSTVTQINTLSTDLATLSTKGLFLEKNIVEIDSNITIDNTTASLYQNKIIHAANDSAEFSITVTLPLPESFSTSIVNLGLRDVLLLPNDGSVVKAANYRIYGNQFATVSLYKYKNLVYALGTIPPAS